MATCCPEQSRHRVFSDVDQAGGGPHPTSLAQMIDDGRCLFLSDLGIEQRGAASLRELLTARLAVVSQISCEAIYGMISLSN